MHGNACPAEATAKVSVGSDRQLGLVRACAGVWCEGTVGTGTGPGLEHSGRQPRGVCELAPGLGSP